MSWREGGHFGLLSSKFDQLNVVVIATHSPSSAIFAAWPQQRGCAPDDSISHPDEMRLMSWGVFRLGNIHARCRGDASGVWGADRDAHRTTGVVNHSDVGNR